MSLHIVVGFDGQGSSANPHPVYTGKSRVEAQTAMEQSNAVRFEVFSNVTGIRKNNPRHVAPLPPVVETTSESEEKTEEKPEHSRRRR